MRRSFGLRLGAAAATLAILAGSMGAAAAQAPVSGHMTPSREYDQERLGPLGLEKCRAYKAVRRRSDQMQAADHGALTAGDTHRLTAELASVRHRAPRHLTPADCGVPL